jgi:hypothetical protein
MPAAASVTVNYGWEDGTGTILGVFPSDSVTASNVATGTVTDNGTADVPASTITVNAIEGSRMLQVTEDNTGEGSDPNPFLAFVDNLDEGDTVEFSFQAYDPTDGRSPSILPNATYTVGGDVTSFAGFATPRQDFDDFGGDGWLFTTTFDGSGSGILEPITIDDGDQDDRDGVVLRAQLLAQSASQSANGGSGTQNFFIDDLSVTVTTTRTDATVTFPDGSVVAVPEPAAAALLGLGGLAMLRRRSA